MNPNSANQRWGLWEYRVYPTRAQRPDYAQVKLNCAKFGRMMFGSASEMRIFHGTDAFAELYWEVAILSEGHPIHDPQYVEWMHDQWRRFLAEGFGHGCVMHAHARLEAGDRQDGRPADQLIILPGIRITDNSEARGN